MRQNTSPQKIPRNPHPRTPPATAARWQAVVNRDATATSFVYGVTTTKIYCLPSCPSRLARRANVQFYDTPSQAERAGFRPCKRCRPSETLEAARTSCTTTTGSAGTSSGSYINPQVQVVQRACQTIRADLRAGLKPTLLRLAREAGLTPSHFHRVFKKVMGVTPGKYTAGIAGDEQVDRDARGENTALFQPWDGGVVVRCDPVGGLLDNSAGSVGAAGDVVLWNDFDALIAAEAEYVSPRLREICPLAGGVGLGLPEFESHGSVEVGDEGVLFVDAVARGDDYLLHPLHNQEFPS